MPRSPLRHLPRNHWLLLASILAFPVAPHVGALIFCTYLLSVAATRTWKQDLSNPRNRAILLAFALLSVWLIFRTGRPWGTGLHSFADPVQYPVTILDYVPFFFVFILLSQRGFSLAEVSTFHWALVATTPLYFMFAIGVRYLEWSGTWSFSVERFTVVFIQLHEPLWDGKITAGFYNWNGLGFYMVICLLAIATLLGSKLATRRTGRANARTSLLACAFLCASFLYCLLMLLWSGSRQAWATVLAMLLPFSALLRIRLRYTVSLILGVVLVSILAVSDFGPLSRASRLVVPNIVEARLNQLLTHRVVAWRIGVFQCALELTGEKPWFGWGIGNMAPECEQRLGHEVNHAHNLFLQLSSEVGLPCTLALTVIFAFIFLSAWRTVFRLDDLQERLLYGGLYLIAAAVVLLSQTSLVVMHSIGLSVIFWSSLAISYSLTNRDHTGFTSSSR